MVVHVRTSERMHKMLLKGPLGMTWCCDRRRVHGQAPMQGAPKRTLDRVRHGAMTQHNRGQMDGQVPTQGTAKRAPKQACHSTTMQHKGDHTEHIFSTGSLQYILRKFVQ